MPCKDSGIIDNYALLACSAQYRSAQIIFLPGPFFQLPKSSASAPYACGLGNLQCRSQVMTRPAASAWNPWALCLVRCSFSPCMQVPSIGSLTRRPAATCYDDREPKRPSSPSYAGSGTGSRSGSNFETKTAGAVCYLQVLVRESPRCKR